MGEREPRKRDLSAFVAPQLSELFDREPAEPDPPAPAAPPVPAPTPSPAVPQEAAEAAEAEVPAAAEARAGAGAEARAAAEARAEAAEARAEAEARAAAEAPAEEVREVEEVESAGVAEVDAGAAAEAQVARRALRAAAAALVAPVPGVAPEPQVVAADAPRIAAPMAPRPVSAPLGLAAHGRGDGERFQPLPGAWLVDGRGDLDIVAPASTPVHVVAGGTVVSRQVAAVVIDGRDGTRYRYGGLRVDTAVREGDTLEAGQILGDVAPSAEGLPRLHLELRAPDGRPLDAYPLLQGLPDPNELGYGTGGRGVDIDPDVVDRSLVQQLQP